MVDIKESYSLNRTIEDIYDNYEPLNHRTYLETLRIHPYIYPQKIKIKKITPIYPTQRSQEDFFLK